MSHNGGYALTIPSKTIKQFIGRAVITVYYNNTHFQKNRFLELSIMLKWVYFSSKIFINYTDTHTHKIHEQLWQVMSVWWCVFQDVYK